ncbi:uncharacterized protein LOC129798014 [Phlebotomus papatasi]|uniref:uncharacterized protein LOC129798014 n=1 Tax=Phlebotomus papatasi TaxID=29031 RepID=UPI002483FD13|nr:uncharacterized protein LOC129798014 [Phlebotomus papatasi]
MILWIIGLFLLGGSLGEENVLEVNTKRILSVVNEDFIGFAIDSGCLTYSKCVEGLRNFSSNAQDVIYVKIHGIDLPSDYENLPAIKELTKSAKIEPIIVLNYQTNSWNPRQHLRLLQKISDFGIKRCTFQLGTDFNGEDTFTYADDLSTFRYMIEAYRKYDNTWRIVGGDLADTVSLVNARIYTKLARNYVASFNWKQRLDSSASDLSATIQHLMDETYLPVSVTYRYPYKPRDLQKCDRDCVSEGLRWAEELGEITGRGFSNVFRSMSRRDFLHHDFSSYISEVYQKMIGSTVLKIKSISDHFFGKFYAYCSRENPGGLVLMGINSADKSLKTTTKFPELILGKAIKEMIFRPENDRIYLNDHLLKDNIPIDISPVFLEKLIQDESLSLTLPPQSVGFWEIPEANASICTENDLIAKPKIRNPIETSMSNLLQELIHEVSQHSGESLRRERRSIPRLFQHQKRDVSEKFKQILGGLFNKKIRGIQGNAFFSAAGGEFAGHQNQQSQTSDYNTQTYSAYQKPLIYTVSPQSASQVFENPIQLNPEQLFGQSYGGATVVPVSVLKQQKIMPQVQQVQQAQQVQQVQQVHQPVQPVHQTQQSMFQIPIQSIQIPEQQIVQTQPQFFTAQHALPVQSTQEIPFTGQILPGQTYEMSEAEAQLYLNGIGGEQAYQSPSEYTQSQVDQYANTQSIYLNPYQDDQLETGQLSYPDLSSLFQTSQPYSLPASGNQDKPMVYMIEPYNRAWESTDNHDEAPASDTSPNPADKIRSGFLTGKFLKDEPEVAIQLNKNDQVKYLGKNKDSQNHDFADELSILAQLGYHEIEKVEDEDKASSKIHSRRRRSIFSDIKQNVLDLDVFPSISLEEPVSPAEGDAINKLRNSLDELLNFIPKGIKKPTTEENPHLESIQSDSNQMKKQCKILSVAMENECLHDTLDDIRYMAKRAAKYISRKKLMQILDWFLPRKIFLKKRRRFTRSPLSSPWSDEIKDRPIFLKDLAEALKTNKIIPMKTNPFIEGDTPDEIDPIEVTKQEEARTSSEEHSGENHKSLTQLINMMNSHIMSWWNLFA